MKKLTLLIPVLSMVFIFSCNIDSNVVVSRYDNGNVEEVIIYKNGKQDTFEFDDYVFDENGNISEWEKVNRRNKHKLIVSYDKYGEIILAGERYDNKLCGYLINYKSVKEGVDHIVIQKFSNSNIGTYYYFDSCYKIIERGVLQETHRLYGETVTDGKIETQIGDEAFSFYINRELNKDSVEAITNRLGVKSNKIRKVKDIKLDIYIN